MLLLCTVRAGTGGDEAGIWAGDLVGTCLSFATIFVMYLLLARMLSLYTHWCKFYIFFDAKVRMYEKYSERNSWKYSVVSSSEVRSRRYIIKIIFRGCWCFDWKTLLLFKAEKGGYKTYVMEVKGNRVYSKLKYESGVHRVQRVPQTETQGRVHTSTATVAIMPEVKYR